MALSIKDPETDRLARELARLTGENLTEAIRIALDERLQRQRSSKAVNMEAVNDILEQFRALPTLDDRSADEILGYDENGLPT